MAVKTSSGRHNTGGRDAEPPQSFPISSKRRNKGAQGCRSSGLFYANRRASAEAAAHHTSCCISPLCFCVSGTVVTSHTARSLPGDTTRVCPHTHTRTHSLPGARPPCAFELVHLREAGARLGQNPHRGGFCAPPANVAPLILSQLMTDLH